MREIKASAVKETIADLCVKSNIYLNKDIEEAFDRAREEEGKSHSLSADIIDKLKLNAEIARKENIPICQDTGMVVVFVTLGQDVHVDGNLAEAINEGVALGYERGFLRKSVVSDPINRVNTKDNTPAVIYYDVVPGDAFRLMVMPKGFGSENMSRLKMFVPADGLEGVKGFVVETVRQAGPNACPPIIVGVGVGGTMDKAALIAKQALLRKVGEHNPDPFWAGVEAELLETINGLKIGPAGFGGKTTALSVNINTYPTHIAGLPVAVNLGCHVTRHAEAAL